MAADAMMTLRKSSIAAGDLFSAISPMFHTTGRWASRLVVSTIRRRPRRYWAAMRSSMSRSMYLRDQICERRRIGQCRTAEEGGQELRRNDFVLLVLRPDRVQLLVFRRPEKCERRDDGAGADAGHNFEFRPVAASGPSSKDAGAERAIRSATRECQGLDDLSSINAFGIACNRRHVCGAVLDFGDRIARNFVSPKADTGHARNFGCCSEPCTGDAVTLHRRRATRERQRDHRQKAYT